MRYRYMAQAGNCQLNMHAQRWLETAPRSLVMAAITLLGVLQNEEAGSQRRIIAIVAAAQSPSRAQQLHCDQHSQ